MPFQSEKQRRFLHANHPEIAKRWEKEYAHGGILDINASEEIISDDGNDIELTDYNAAFDDPNDLSTGVKTLFQAKDGGRIGYQWGGPGGKSPGTSSTGGTRGGSTNRERGIQQAYSPPAYSPTGDATVAGDIAAADRKRKAEADLAFSRSPASDKEKYDTKEQHLADIPGDLEGIRVNQYKTKVNANYKREAYNKALATQKAKMKKMGLLKLIPAGIVLFVTQNPKLAMDTFSLSGSDVMNIARYGLPVMETKKELIEALETSKTAHLQDVDIFNPNEMVNLDDTDFPDIMKELKDLTKKRAEDDIENNESPILPKVVPIDEEIEEYEGTYAMSPWERIKANQAKRALLVEKGIIQDNPIVDESVTDITMQANRGGLANLFRVKNQ